MGSHMLAALTVLVGSDSGMIAAHPLSAHPSAAVNNCRMPLALVFLAAGSNLWFETIKTVRASNSARFGIGIPQWGGPRCWGEVD
jgi:hypothetical protein